MKITALELENVKRIRALRLEPSQNGLTVIGGRNGQGKTSVLSAIAYALGGEKFKPSALKREDAVSDAYIHLETDDGLIIERKGKNAALTVTDTKGKKGGQRILDDLISKLAIDLPAFLNATDKEKAETLLNIIGVGDQLKKLEDDEKTKYNIRLSVGQQQSRKAKAAEEMPFYEDAPDEVVSPSDLIEEQRRLLAHNEAIVAAQRDAGRRAVEVAALEGRLADALAAVARLQDELGEAQRAADLADEAFEALGEPADLAELEKKLAEYEEVNAQVRANELRAAAVREASDLASEYDSLTREIEEIRRAKTRLLEGASLPYPGLSVCEGKLTLDGKPWDCMSGSQQLIVGTAIASRLNPKCGFVLLDKLEQLDLESLAEFGKWLEANKLQCIATRVSKGAECSLIIEDGEAVTGEAPTISTSSLVDDDDY